MKSGGKGIFASIICERVVEIKWTMDKAMEVADYIDKMPYAAKAAIGTAGFVIAVTAGAVSLPAAFIGITSLAGGATAGAVSYTINAAITHEWNNRDFVHSVVNGALTDYMFAGVAAGVYGIVHAVKSGKVTIVQVIHKILMEDGLQVNRLPLLLM